MAINSINNTSSPADFYAQQAQKRREEQSEQLASGTRITTAAIDPAGLQIANRLTSQVNEAEAYGRIYQNQVSLNNIASAELQGTTEALQANQTLAIQAGNGIYNADDLAALQAQADANTATIPNAGDLGVDGVDITDPGAGDAFTQAQRTTDAANAQLGAESNAAESAYRSTQAALEAQSAARSRILDTNYALASSQQAQNDVLFQTSVQSIRGQQEYARSVDRLL
ncbi:MULTISPECIES: flagellin [Aliagarivorans]|uniref:flagellin n=1 Tax=Aliagarivorans TaxID=882379 RepID=UPI0004276F44|nr:MULTISPECIES: hypothetical protein [Aliagarivorans]